MLWAVKTRSASAPTAAGSEPAAAAAASANGSMKPGWLKYWRSLSMRGVLSAAGERAVGGRHEGQRGSHPARCHGRDGVGQVRVPVPVPPVDRQVHATRREVLPD